MRNVWILVAAAALVAGGTGYLIGRSQQRKQRIFVEEGDGRRPELVDAPPAEVSREAPVVDDGPSRLEAPDELPRVSGPAGRPSVARDEGGPPPATFSLEGATEADEISQRLMDFADGQLGRGEEGYLEILRAMHTLVMSKELLQDLTEEQVVRQIYPWIRYLVAREEQVVGMSDWVFRSLAEKPETFAEIDSDVIEAFTEGLGAILPGVVPPEHIEILRGYAEAFLAVPEDRLPVSVQKQRRRVERLVQRYWATPESQDAQLAKLRAGALPPDMVLELLGRVPTAKLSGIDVTTALEPRVSAADFSVIRVLSRHRSVIDFGRLDRVLVEALAQERTVHAWFLRQYFAASGREDWSRIQPFFDLALSSSSERARHQAGQALYQLPEVIRPPASYVADVLARYDLGKYASDLRTRYGLK